MRPLHVRSLEEGFMAVPLPDARELSDEVLEALRLRALRGWGFTAKRPRRHARDQDPEEVCQWLEETYPAIAARAEREGAEIHWCDEVGAAADQHPGRGYAPEGEAAAMEVPDRHIRANQ